MGSCVSKCCQASPTIDGDSSVVPVQEKLVISESTVVATELYRDDLPETHTSSLVYSSSSSSASPLSSSSASSSCTITSITTASTGASSVCPQLSSAKHKPLIVVLDPHKQVIASPSPRTLSLPAKRTRSSLSSMTARHTSSKESLRENGVYKPSSKCMEKAKLQRVQHQIQSARRRQPLVEDLNNPLISMDCFIFL